MPRKIVPLVTGEKYHIYNRGVDKRKIFSSKNDYLRFYQSLLLFNTIAPVQNFRLAKSERRTLNSPLVWLEAYCLLPNHFHLLLSPCVEGGISEFMKRVAGGYTSFYNEQYERSGSLFQGTFKRVHIENDEQYRYVFAYVNENHSVHNIKIVREIYHSSSLHYQNIARSRALNSELLHQEYNHAQGVKLAQMIHTKRKLVTDTDLTIETHD
ncbi:MAG: putative transposase [Candidatus Azotimanducaceae bacterium]|jgi:putative transposase